MSKCSSECFANACWEEFWNSYLYLARSFKSTSCFTLCCSKMPCVLNNESDFYVWFDAQVPFADNPGLSKPVFLKPGADLNIALHASPAARDSAISNFRLLSSFSRIFPIPFQTCIDTWHEHLMRLKLVIWWLVFHPYMTFVMDWVLDHTKNSVK